MNFDDEISDANVIEQIFCAIENDSNVKKKTFCAFTNDAFVKLKIKQITEPEDLVGTYISSANF